MSSLKSSEWLRCVERCHAHLDAADQAVLLSQLAKHVLRFANSRPVRAVCQENSSGQLGSSAYLVLHPGALGCLGGASPPTVASGPAGVENWRDYASESIVLEVANLLRQLIEDVRSEVELVQAIFFDSTLGTEHDEWLCRCLQQAGFRFVTELLQYEYWLEPTQHAHSKLGQNSSEPRLADEFFGEMYVEREAELNLPADENLAWIPWSEENGPLFEDIVERTYCQTLDVPELNGVRSIRNTLVGYESALSTAEKPWWLLQYHGEPVGCLLLCQHGESVVEMVYVGVIPEARGRGLGRQSIQFMKDWARRKGCEKILLAVDRRNQPAIAIYEQFGFRQFGSARGWLFPVSREGNLSRWNQSHP